MWKEYENEIKEILNALNNCNFEDLDEYNFNDLVNDFEEKYHKSFRASNGATKGVLIFEDYDFVIKIPFSYCDGDKLCGADETEAGDEWNYCEQESIRYKLAEKAGFGEIFLKTELLDCINFYPIYIQQYATILSTLDNTEYEENYSSSKDLDRKIVKNINDEENFDCLDEDWESDLLVKYGIDKFKKFKEYIKENYIIDLRRANIGYVEKNPVLVDYAGFNEEAF